MMNILVVLVYGFFAFFSNLSFAQTSEQNRQAQHFSLTYSPAGSAVGGIPTTGADLGVHLSDNNILEASYYQGEIDILFYSVQTRFASLRLKHFFGNSFYMNAGVGTRELSVSWEPSNFTGDETLDEDLFSVTSVGGLVAIGNRWSWRYFTIGCDWIGTFFPTARIKQPKEDSDAIAELKDEDKEEYDKLQKDLDTLSKTNSAILLVFYLGISI